MTPTTIALGVLVAVSLGLVLVMALSQRAALRAPAPPEPSDWPPVSILKPLKGVDADLADNLRSVFRLDYPCYEVLLGTEDADDPALAVARAVAAEHPHVPSRVVCDRTAVGLNPKVNNLANLTRRARFHLLLVSDSNVSVGPDYLRDLVAHRASAGAGLVWSLFRGVGGRGLGAQLEALQLNVQVMGGVAALSRVLNIPCAVGKSMLLDREDLERIGGYSFLGRFLAEDQVCAEELARRWRPVVASPRVIDNVLGRRSVREFAARHLRWSKLRRHVNLPGYLGELLLNPVFLALAGAAALRTPESAGLAGFALAAMSAIDASQERRLGIRRPLVGYPALELLLSVVRGLLWFVPFFSSTLVWRSNRLRIGPRTRIDLREAAEGSPFDTRERRVPA